MEEKYEFDFSSWDWVKCSSDSWFVVAPWSRPWSLFVDDGGVGDVRHALSDLLLDMFCDFNLQDTCKLFIQWLLLFCWGKTNEIITIYFVF